MTDHVKRRGRVGELLPDQCSENSEARIRRIVEFWSALRICGDPGATTWDVLDEIEQQVTQALANGDLDLADRLSARAWCLVEGCG